MFGGAALPDVTGKLWPRQRHEPAAQVNVFLGFADVVVRQSSVQQRHGQIAVHVPAAERGDGGAGQLILVAAAEVAHLQGARLVIVRYLDMSRC